MRFNASHDCGWKSVMDLSYDPRGPKVDRLFKCPAKNKKGDACKGKKEFITIEPVKVAATPAPKED